MQRKFLEDMGLTKEQIDQIMAENGKDITREQGVANTYKTQLEGVQDKLKGFDGVNVADLQGQIKTLTNDLATQKTSYETQIEGMKFTSLLEGKVNSMKPRNSKAVMALLDLDTLKKSKNQDTDITNALEAIKKDNDYLFEASETSGTQTRRVVTGTQTNTDNTDKKAAANEAFRSLFGKQE